LVFCLCLYVTLEKARLTSARDPGLKTVSVPDQGGRRHSELDSENLKAANLIQWRVPWYYWIRSRHNGWVLRFKRKWELKERGGRVESTCRVARDGCREKTASNSEETRTDV